MNNEKVEKDNKSDVFKKKIIQVINIHIIKYHIKYNLKINLT